MLFKDKLHTISQNLNLEFKDLFTMLLQKQSHVGDLLLVGENGFYFPESKTWDNDEKKYSPYAIGEGQEGHSASLHYEFIHQYRSSVICNYTCADYLKIISSESEQKTENFIKQESYTIQLEMLIYLKIWESDTFIKRFYQLARLLYNEPYDWHFRIQESNRDRSATGKRDDIIRNKIRDRLQKDFPCIYDAFKLTYKTQIRNSIAHSKYSFLGRNIHLNNYIKNDPSSPLHGLTFNEWIEIFHTTMIIYNEYIGLFEDINQYYTNLAKSNDNKIEVRINREVVNEIVEYSNLSLTEGCNSKLRDPFF